MSSSDDNPGEGAGEGAAARPSLAAVSAEFALFEDFVSRLADDDVVAGIEAAVGTEAAARARAAIRTLTEVDAGLRKAAGDTAGAEQATLPPPGAAPPPEELAARAVRAAPVGDVSAEFAPFEEFIDRVTSPGVLETMTEAVGPDLAARAREAASALLDVSAELRLRAPSAPEPGRPSAGLLSAELAPFDSFVASLHPETAGVLEDTLGAEAAARARAAARALMDVSAELRMVAPPESVEERLAAAAPAAAAPPGAPPGFDELRALHERAWSSAEESLVAIADMHIAAWTAAKRSVLAAAELSRGAMSSFLSAELALFR